MVDWHTNSLDDFQLAEISLRSTLSDWETAESEGVSGGWPRDANIISGRPMPMMVAD